MNTQTRHRLFLTLLATLASLLLAPPSTEQSETPDATCPVTPLEDRLPSIIPPMAGYHPVWLVDGSAGTWPGSDARVKSLWVFSRDVSGDLVLRGQKRDGSGVLRFQYGVEASATTEFFLADATDHVRVVPGGATKAIRERYTFLAMYLIYPEAGCWEITARLGAEEVRIVVEVQAKAGEG